MVINSLLILSIGPVQGFIAQARRAADLYAGSQLLARLVSAAIDAVGVEKVLYPRKTMTAHPQSLPNKLIACLSADQASEVADKAEQRIRERWHEMTTVAKERLGDCAPPDEIWMQLWNDQLGQIPEIYWTVTPWPEGWSYEQVYVQAGRDFDARKRLRNFGPIEEHGRKCTVCGERAALHRMNESPRMYWRTVADQVGEAKLRPGGKEQLCAICAVKRFGKLGQERFPSVSEMAAVPFKKAILQQLQGNELDLRLVQALGQYPQILSRCKVPTIRTDVVPALAAMPVGDTGKELARKFLRYDGEWLFAETYERKLADVGLLSSEAKGIKQAKRVVQALIQSAQDLDLEPSRPTPYYALLFADGDHMGKQIRAAAPHGLERHIAISKSLAEFAAKDVYRIVEQEYDGKVIYAGGDDVVAMLSLPTALAAAEALRRTYAKKMANLLEIPTMSAGIAIAHHLSPLGEVLRAARQAERMAKERYGRNAVAVVFRKRGGAPVIVGAGWEFGDNAQATVDLLFDVQYRFAVAHDRSQREKGLSLGLAHTLLDEARFLSGQLPWIARQAEVERVLYRAAPGHLLKAARQAQANQLAEMLIRLAESIENRQSLTEREPSSPQESDPGMLTVANWLMLLRFIVQEASMPLPMRRESNE